MTDSVSGRERGSSREAAGSLAGYLYQVHVALLELLRRAGDDPGAKLALESVDDIRFEAAGTSAELLQTKHHATRGSLGDASEDVWRTLGLWIDATSGDVELDDAVLSLLSTNVAPFGSAMSLLRRNPERDPKRAVEVLEATARTSHNARNAPSYQAFLNLETEEREAIASRMVVIDGSPLLGQLTSEIGSELRWAARPDDLEPFVDRVVGWWERRVIAALSHETDVWIEAAELQLYVDDLREHFSVHDLPIDIFDDDPELDDLEPRDRTFVRQLVLIALSEPLIELAIRNYKRAFLQRSRWLRDGLIGPSELARYEDRLQSEWRLRYERMMFEHSTADDAGKEVAGYELLKELEDAPLWIRDRCEEPFVVRGSYHKLADELRVGWHPEFVARLRVVLDAAG